MRLARIASQMHPFANSQVSVARHHDAELLPGLAAHVHERLRPHRLDELGNRRERIAGGIVRRHEGARPYADGDRRWVEAARRSLDGETRLTPTHRQHRPTGLEPKQL